MRIHSSTISRALIIFIWLSIGSQISLPIAFCLEVPPLKGPVNDYGGILSSSTETQLEQVLLQLEQTDSSQVVVLTIASLKGDNLEQFSIRVVENWKIGQSGLDNGALLLVAVADRKVRIEVGYGLEGSLTDLTAGRIIQDVILPKFRQENFDQGVIDGVGAIIKTVKGEYTPIGSHSNAKQEDPFGLFAMLIFFSFFIGNMLRSSKFASAIACGIGAPLLGTIFFGFSLPLIVSLIPVGIIFGLISAKLHTRTGHSRRSGRSGYYGNGGSGSSTGGFGGFSGGGGGFGGGGASGGW